MLNKAHQLVLLLTISSNNVMKAKTERSHGLKLQLVEPQLTSRQNSSRLPVQTKQLTELSSLLLLKWLDHKEMLNKPDD